MKVWQTALLGLLVIVFASPALGQARDHYYCYQAKQTKKVCAPGQVNAGAPCKNDDEGCNPGGDDSCIKAGKFPKKIYAGLDDTRLTSVGEARTFEVKKVKNLCLPIDKNGEGITDSGTHYVVYQIKQQKKVCDSGANAGVPCKDSVADCAGATCIEVDKFDKKDAKNTSILVGDQFGSMRVDAGKVAFLMSPASVCEGIDSTPCPDAPPAAGAEDHFKCYAIKGTKKYCGNPADGNYLEACKKDENCTSGPDSCMKLPKFPKGLGATLDDDGTLIASPPGRAFALSKPSFLCKAVQKTLPPNGTPEDVVNPAARLLCYKGKANKQCDAGSLLNEFGICKKDKDCGGSCSVTTAMTCSEDEDCPPEEDCNVVDDTCNKQTKFNKKDPSVQGFYVNDQFDGIDDSPDVIQHHRLNLNKEELLCVPACEFSPLTLRATTLSIPTTGNPGDGLDVDMNPATCQPTDTSCSGGIDNSLGKLINTLQSAGLDLNAALQESVTDGDINILLNLDELGAADGTRVVTGHVGDLAAPAGCTDQNDGGQSCNYLASCAGDVDIVFPVDITGLPGSPATVEGGGPGTTFGFNIPFGDVDLSIAVHDVLVEATLNHAGGDVTTGSGIIGGAIIQRELKNTIASIPGGLCAGGAESGQQCPPATCPSSFCLPFTSIASFIDATERDIDTDGLKTCEGGSNNGEPCSTLTPDCPDDSNPPVTACEFEDGVSIGLVFSGIDAQIVGAD